MVTEEQVRNRAANVEDELRQEFEQLRCCDNGEPLALIIARLELRIEAARAALDKCSCVCPHISAAEKILKVEP